MEDTSDSGARAQPQEEEQCTWRFQQTCTAHVHSYSDVLPLSSHPHSHTFAHCTYLFSLAGDQHVHFHTLRAFHSAHTLLHLPTCLHAHSTHTATFIQHNQHI